MNEFEGLKRDEQLEEAVQLMEELMKENEQKDQTIEQLKAQLKNLNALKEKWKRESNSETVSMLEMKLEKTEQELNKKSEKVWIAERIIKELRDKVREEKSELYSCKWQKEELEKQNARYEKRRITLWLYAILITGFRAVQSEIFLQDVMRALQTIWKGILMAKEGVILLNVLVAQIRGVISYPAVGWVVYCLIWVLIAAVLLSCVGVLLYLMGRKIWDVYRKCCWDEITIFVSMASVAVVVFWGEWIRSVVPVNLIVLVGLVQVVYVGVRGYVWGCRRSRGY